MIATLLTKAVLDADRTIAGGEPIKVYYILFCNKGGSDVDIVGTDADGNSIFDVAVAARTSVCFSPTWIADNGLIFSSNAGGTNVIVHVWHGPAGA